MTSIDKLWATYPNPIAVDKDDLLDVVENLEIDDCDRAEQEIFADWYRMVPEAIREDAALDSPADMMLAELIAYTKREAYRHVIDRNAEVRHLQRLIHAQQMEQERLRRANQSMSARMQTLCGYMPEDVKRMCSLQGGCAACPVGAAAHGAVLDCRQYVEQEPAQAEFLARDWRRNHG